MNEYGSLGTRVVLLSMLLEPSREERATLSGPTMQSQEAENEREWGPWDSLGKVG